MYGPVAVAAAPFAAALATAAESTGFDPTQLIGTAVTPVIVILLLLTGKLHTDGEVKRLAAELETERAARVALQSTLTEGVVPALTRSTDAVTRSTDLMESLARRQAGGG